MQFLRALEYRSALCASSQKTHHSQGRELPLRGIRGPVLDLCNCKLKLCRFVQICKMPIGGYVRTQKCPVLCQHLHEEVILT